MGMVTRSTDEMEKAAAAFAARPRFPARAQDLTITLQLALSIDADRVDRIVFDVWSLLTTVKNLVGADVEQARTNCFRRTRQKSRSTSVDRERPLRVPLAAIDIGVRRAIDDHIRANPADAALDCLGVSDVQNVLVDAEHLVAALLERLREVRAEHALVACYQEAHRISSMSSRF